MDLNKKVTPLLIALAMPLGLISPTILAQGPVDDTQLVSDGQVVANDELNATIQLTGATYFDGHPFWGTKQIMTLDGRTEVPYNGWQLMELDVEIPFQEGLEIKSITPSVASQYSDLSNLVKDDQNAKWSYPFFFYANGQYDFKIDYTLAGEEKSTSTSFTVDGLVSIQDIAMRRHLINTYGELSGIYYNSGQYITKEILATTLTDPWGNISFDFGKDGDNGTTAQNTTSLDGLQYLTNIHGMYLFDCSKLAPGETIEPITNTVYPNLKILRISEIFNNRPNLPEGSYPPEMIAQAISHMPNLSELSMCYTGFVDLPVIGQLNGQLNTLEADHCEIESVEGIEKHPNIQMISLAVNKIQSLQPLANAQLDKVTFMDLGANQIFDLSPLNATLNPNIVGAKRFGASRQTIYYDQTVIANLQADQYEIELPMPIDIDGSQTDAVQVAVGFPDGTQKQYTPIKNEGKTFISIPKADVESSAVNPFENMQFAFTFNNMNGADTRTKGAFSGTVYFNVSPFATKYPVLYNFVSGTPDVALPEEVNQLLPNDPIQYDEGQTIDAIQPTSTSVTVADGTWTFEGYDDNSKVADQTNVNAEGNILFTGTWTFQKSTDPDQPTNPDKPVDPDQPVDPDKPNQPTNPDQPIDPNEPTEPNNPAQPDTNEPEQSKPNKPGSVDTGRRTNLLLSSLLFLGAGISMLGVVLMKAKSFHDQN